MHIKKILKENCVNFEATFHKQRKFHMAVHITAWGNFTLRTWSWSTSLRKACGKWGSSTKQMEERDFLSILISIVEVAKKDENSDLCWKKTPWAKQTFTEYLISSTQTRECKQLSCFFNQQNCYQLVYSSVQLSFKSFSQEVTHNRLKAKTIECKRNRISQRSRTVSFQKPKWSLQPIGVKVDIIISRSEWRLASSSAN